MGLDMYLQAEKFASGYEFSGERSKQFYGQLVELVDLGDIVETDTPHATVRITVAYWRKANAIHRWFVENVQRGQDNCGTYYVDREDLQRLHDACLEVMYPLAQEDDDRKAAEILPTQEGFFFGPTDYGECYLQNVKYTIVRARLLLDRLPDDFNLFYHSSW